MLSHALAVAVLGVLALPAPDDAGAVRRFVIGTPGRLALVGDRQLPRRFERVDSAVSALADVEQVVDATWLAHEVAGYARRVADCAPPAPMPCRRAARRLGDAWGILLTTGGRAELVWTAGPRAVRLRWRRLVATPTGTMTVEDPPADFTAALLAELPSDFDPLAADDRHWTERESDRRLYYVARALAAVGRGGAAPDAALHFARAGLLAVETAEGIAAGDGAGAGDGVAALLALRARLQAALARRAAARQTPFLSAEPWCAAPSMTDALPPLAGRP